jgi:uncharacterized protein YndB with AHSA1/START domain
MDKPSFVYVTYIATTPEKLWNALMDGEMTKQYWGLARNVSDWKVGSTWQHQDYDDPSLVKVVGKVVESAPPRRLVLTWAYPADAANESKHTRVTFEIEPFMETVRLTVTHSDLEPRSEMQRGITQGWPGVLSGLKTLLETGKPMMPPRRWGGARS